MLKLYLYRHGETSSNLKKLYLGSSEEPLCEVGKNNAERVKRVEVERVFASPMLRCMQTANIIFPKTTIEKIEDLRECSFGIFEKKSYDEIKDSPHFIKWCSSEESYALPEGESVLDFKKRCSDSFFAEVLRLIEEGVRSAAFVIHGGSIMAVLDRFYFENKGFYYWQAKNCEGYCVTATLACGHLVLKDARLIKL